MPKPRQPRLADVTYLDDNGKRRRRYTVRRGIRLVPLRYPLCWPHGRFRKVPYFVPFDKAEAFPLGNPKAGSAYPACFYWFCTRESAWNWLRKKTVDWYRKQVKIQEVTVALDGQLAS